MAIKEKGDDSRICVASGEADTKEIEDATKIQQNVTRTRNSKNLDTKNQQFDTTMQRKFNKTNFKWCVKKAKSILDKDELI